jgi:carbon-monoxide dehydrogenase medium subunit
LKPAPFAFHAARSRPEALEALSRWGDDAKVLAGGQSLVPMLALRLARFAHLVDLNRADDLAGVRREDGWLSVGAMTRQRHLERHTELGRTVPLLARATPLIGHFQVRNRGTLGGSISHADPASEYPAVALALDATMRLDNAGSSRLVGARDFFVSTWTTCLAPDELLCEVRFPVWEGPCGFSIREVARRRGDFALVGVAGGLRLDPAGRLCGAALCAFGVGPTPVRAPEAEAALAGQPADALGPPELEELGHLAASGLEPVDDVHASASYRRSVAATLARQVLADCLEEATRG